MAKSHDQKSMVVFYSHSPGCRTEPNQTEPAEITEPAQPNLRKLTDNYDYRYRVLAPFTDSHLGVINIIIINHYYYYYY